MIFFLYDLWKAMDKSSFGLQALSLRDRPEPLVKMRLVGTFWVETTKQVVKPGQIPGHCWDICLGQEAFGWLHQSHQTAVWKLGALFQYFGGTWAWACLKMMGHPEKPQRLDGFIMVDHHFLYHLIASGWLGTPFS